MGRVFNIFTREEIFGPLFSKESAIKVAKKLIVASAPDFDQISEEERLIIGYSLDFVSNLAGMASSDLYEAARVELTTQDQDKASGE